MEKPITVARAEFQQSLVSVIGNAGLPPFIIADCLQSALIQIQALADQQYQQDKIAYEQANTNIPECVELKEVEQNG